MVKYSLKVEVLTLLPDRLMVGRHPLEVVILGSSPSPATK